MKSVLPAGSCFTDGTGEEVLESPGLMNSGLGKGQVHDRGRERGSKSGSISTKCGCWAASAMVEKYLASVLQCHAIMKNLKSRNSSFET